MSLYLKSDLNDTICALATAGGVGAIGVIRVSGESAIKMVNAVFKGKNLEMQNTHTVHFGKILDESFVLDEVLATLPITWC
jgi:tRNA modification GTPase